MLHTGHVVGLRMTPWRLTHRLAPIEGKVVAGGKAAPPASKHRLRPEEISFYGRGFIFQAPVFEYAGFEMLDLTTVSVCVHACACVHARMCSCICSGRL